MIKANFKIADLDFQLKIDLLLPVLPSVGDQIFLGDFMDDEEQEALMKQDNTVSVDDMFVESFLWMYSQQKKEPYVLIWVNEK